MKSRKDVVISILAIFCLAATLFLVMPTKSQEPGQYDLWIDNNDDGTIDVLDAIGLANVFMTSGTPINKTALLLELMGRVDSLNSSLLDLQACFETRIADLNATLVQQQSRIAEVEAQIAILNATKLGKPDYDSGWINPTVGALTYLTHNLNTTRVLVNLIANYPDTFWENHQLFYGIIHHFDSIHQITYVEGATWGCLNETAIAIYRGYDDAVWSEARLMMWIIP